MSAVESTERYFIVNRQSGNVLAGPFTRFVDAFNARAHIGPVGMVVTREVQS